MDGVKPKATTTSRVLVLYTGGTIGMKPGEGGSLRPAQGFLAVRNSSKPNYCSPSYHSRE